VAIWASSPATEGLLVSDFVLEKFLPYQLAVLARVVSDQFSQKYQKQFTISVPEWRVVAHLSQAEKISIREIYQKVGMDKSKTSRAATRLVEAGYVSKETNPRDKRLIELSLTGKGRAMIEAITPMALTFDAESLRCLTPSQKAVFTECMTILIEALIKTK
jgi:DNA-binding MarR family transcriptional regulator